MNELSFMEDSIEKQHHNFQINEKGCQICTDCQLKFYNYKKLKNAYFELYTKYFQVPLSEIKHINDSRNYYFSQINEINQNYCLYVLDFLKETMQDLSIFLSS